MNKLFTCLIGLVFLCGCGTTKTPYYSEPIKNWDSQEATPGKKIVHSLFLVGDTGELDDLELKTNIVVEAVKKDISKAVVETSLVFLGDNIYPHGMPKKKSPERAHAEDIIDAQLQSATYHDGKTYFIPGNHDWNKHKPGGRKAILRQEDYIESYFDKDEANVKFYPNNACGDPKVVKINKDLVFVFLDTQWWLQNWSKEKKMNQGCDIKSKGDLIERMEEILIDHKNDEVVVLMHHPIKSDGKHGGKFGIKQHIFPLTEAKHTWWFPTPIIGSLYPAFRRLTGSTQDITNVENQALMQTLDKMAKKLRVNVIFATGHDHGLQYFEDAKVKYIVSGAGGKTEFVKKGGDAKYARSTRGYAKVDFYEDFEAWVNFYTVDPVTEESKLEYRKKMREPRAGTVEEEKKFDPVSEGTKVIAANKKLGAGPVKTLFFGSQYRDLWTTSVEAEIIDLETKHGGLTPIKKGGGFASNSLRMQKEDGKQYILRSIKKDYTKLIPPGFQNLKLVDVIADQNSASHPYNALVIPKLSQAAGVYYTHPKLVYLQHQRGLGNYNSQFPEELYLLEERPNGNWEDAAQFGNSKEIIGYTDLLATLREKKNHFIDQEWVLKSRMFDLFIHDWDRHDDQWRWAKFKEDGKNIYRPIPRDRDQAFYRFKGIVPWLIANLSMKQFKAIKGDCKDVEHLAFNGKHFDRYFLHALGWEEWEQVITQMQSDITDEDIEEAMSLFPKETLVHNDEEELGEILKSRRDNLLKIGKRLYDFLSKEVEITGTDNKDRFYVKRYPDGSVNVKYDLSSKEHGVLKKFERTFLPSETKEIRLYGLRGKDIFNISGNGNRDIKIKIIGGEDDDEVINETRKGGIAVYDELEGMTLKGKLIDKRSSDITVNEYDRNGFQYNTSLPFLTIGNSVDDGWWFGGSYNWVKRAWRKSPYKSSQKFSFSLAPGSRDALMVDYEGHFPNVFGEVDFAPHVNIHNPEYENYFGLGNLSTNNLSNPIEYNWVRMTNINVNPRIRIGGNRSLTLDVGPMFNYVKIQNTEDRVSEDVDLGFDDEVLEGRKYWGGNVQFTLGISDSNIFPTNGFILTASASHLRENALDEKISSFDINGKMYFRLSAKPKIVFATQMGYGRSFGDLQFYQYQDLGNNRGLRGFRNERFRGEKVFYHNMDLRFKLIKFKNNIIPMDIGLLAGYDYGRISLEGENFDDWHNSTTVGVFFEILGAITLQPYYSFNKEQNTFSLRAGFNF